MPSALIVLMVVLVWVQIGYPVVIFMAALQRVDPELYEAAELDGANWFQRFSAITMSIIRPEIFVVTLTSTIAALKVFGPVYVITGGGPAGATLVPAYYAIQEFFTKRNVGYGATIATVLTIVVVDRLHHLHQGAELDGAQRKGGPLMAVGTVLVTTPATSAKAPKRAPRARGGMTKKRGVDWLLLALVIVGALAVLAPFYLILVNSFKSPIDYANGGPLALPESLDFTGIVNFWERVNFPEKVWNSIFISGVVAVLAVLISMLNAFAIGIGRVQGSHVDRAAVPDGQPAAAGGAPLPALLHVQRGGSLRQRVVGDHHLHGGSGGVRHVPALVGLRHLSEGDPRSRIHRRCRRAGRSCGGSCSR